MNSAQLAGPNSRMVRKVRSVRPSICSKTPKSKGATPTWETFILQCQSYYFTQRRGSFDFGEDRRQKRSLARQQFPTHAPLPSPIVPQRTAKSAKNTSHFTFFPNRKLSKLPSLKNETNKVRLSNMNVVQGSTLTGAHVSVSLSFFLSRFPTHRRG